MTNYLREYLAIWVIALLAAIAAGLWPMDTQAAELSDNALVQQWYASEPTCHVKADAGCVEAAAIGHELNVRGAVWYTGDVWVTQSQDCLLYTSPSPRDRS